MPEMTPRAFSFNSPHGACPDCQGLGAVYDFDPARIVPDESLSLPTARSRRGRKATGSSCARRSRSLSSTSASTRDAVRRPPPKDPRRSCSSAPGSGRAARPTRRRRRPRAAAKDPFGAGFEGIIPNLRRRYEEGRGPSRRTSSRIARSGRAHLRGRAAEGAEPRRPGEGPHDLGVRRPCRSATRCGCSTSSS